MEHGGSDIIDRDKFLVLVWQRRIASDGDAGTEEPAEKVFGIARPCFPVAGDKVGPIYDSRTPAPDDSPQKLLCNPLALRISTIER